MYSYLKIKNDDVFLIEKPNDIRHQYYEASLSRAVLYKKLFETCLDTHPMPYEMSVPVFVGDGALENSNIPVFSFQKPRGNKSPLLPDVDLCEAKIP